MVIEMIKYTRNLFHVLRRLEVTPLSEYQKRDIDMCMQYNNVAEVEHIKRYHNIGLKESKEYVERLIDKGLYKGREPNEQQ